MRIAVRYFVVASMLAATCTGLSGQADLSGAKLCYLVNKNGSRSGIILDFGGELQGAIQIITGITGGKEPARIRVTRDCC